MRVLCLNPWYSQIIKNNKITFIDEICDGFQHKSLYSQLKYLLMTAKDYDRIVFYRDNRLAMAYALTCGLWRHQDFILHEFYLPEMKGRNIIKYPLFYIVFHLMKAVIVHSTFEVDYLSDLFKIDKSRICFIPYYYYGGISNCATGGYRMGGGIVPGRSRDLGIMLKCIDSIDGRLVIVGGAGDRINISSPKIDAYWEVDKETYSRLFDEATWCCIPLFKDKFKRSFGQIALLTAFSKRKPLIVADVPAVRDYVNEDVCLLYDAENEVSLKDAIQRLQKMTDEERIALTDRAAEFVKQFNQKEYAAHFERIMTEQ